VPNLNAISDKELMEAEINESIAKDEADRKFKIDRLSSLAKYLSDFDT